VFVLVFFIFVTPGSHYQISEYQNVSVVELTFSAVNQCFI